MGLVINKGEGAVLRVNLGRPIVTNGTFIRSCVRAMHFSKITLGRTCYA